MFQWQTGIRTVRQKLNQVLLKAILGERLLIINRNYSYLDGSLFRGSDRGIQLLKILKKHSTRFFR